MGRLHLIASKIGRPKLSLLERKSRASTSLYKSKTYLDSLDASQNKFKLGNLISGYSYENSFENKVFSISSPLSGLNFNTVQGYNSNLDINYTKRYDEYK